MTSRQRVVLVGIVLLAAGLRLWGLALGLPNVDGRPDEREMLVHTAGFPDGDLNPRWFVYPNLFMYIVWLWTCGVLALRRFWTPTPGYADALHTALPTVLFTGRLLSAVAGTLTVLIVYRVAARGRGPSRGLVAALLLATCWLHVRDSHFVKTEALLAAMVLVAIAALARWAESGRRRHAMAAGAAVGLAMGIKYPAVFLLLPAWVADRLRAGRSPHWFAPSRDLLLLGVSAAVIFVLVCPYLLLDFGRTRDTASFLGLALYATRPDAAAMGSGGTLAWLESRAFSYHLTHSLRYGCGLLQTLALPAAIAWALYRREPLLVLAATFAALVYLVAGASPVHLARYLTPATPLVAVLLAELVIAVSMLLPTPRVRALVAFGLAALLAAEPLRASIRADRIAAREDTRVAATAWMRSELPAGARVAVLGTVLLPQGAPPLPPGIVGVNAAPTPEAYAAAGVTHLVTHDHPLMFSTVDPAVLARLAPSLRLVAAFSPFSGPPAGGYEVEDAYYIPFFDFAGVGRPGPEVKIYAVAAPSS